MQLKSNFIKSEKVLFCLLLLLGNLAIWLPMFWADFPTIGLGHDSQLFAAAINGELRKGNMPWDLMTKLLSAREDIFSYPYFGIMYPFYWTLGLNGDFSYAENLKLDFISVVFHMIVASFTFSLLLKRMGCRYYVSVIFGLLYAYSLHLKMWSSWIWALSGYTWIPLCLLGIWECVNRQNYRIGIVYLGMGFGFIALGTALPLAYALVLSGAWFFACLLKARPDVNRQVKIYLSITAGGIISFCIGASHLIPTLYRSSEYIRWYSGGHLVGGLKPPYSGTLDSTLNFSLSTFKQLFMPVGWSGGVGHIYLGAAIVVLFIYFVYKNYRQPFIWPLLFIAVYFLFDAFGDATVIHKITYKLPLLGSIRYPLANVYIPIVIILILSAKSLNQLISNLQEEKHQKSSQSLFVLNVLAVVSLIVAICSYYYQSEFIWSYRVYALWVIVPPAVISVVWFFGKKVTNNSRSWLIALPIFLLSAQLVQGSVLFHPKVPKKNSLYTKCDQFVSLYDFLRKARRNVSDNNRLVINIGPDFNGCLKKHRISGSLLQSLAMMSGWNVLQIYQSPRPFKEFRLFNKLSHSKRLEDVKHSHHAGITHILSSSSEKQLSDNNDKLSKGFVLSEVKNSNLGLSNIGCIDSLSEDFVNFVTRYGTRKIKLDIESNAKNLKEAACHDSQISKGSQFLQLRRLASGIEYQVEQDSPSLFLSDQVYSDDWDVIISGARTNAFVADGYRLAAVLPAGKFKLKLQYNPADFKYGFILTCFGFFVLLIIIIQPLFIKLK